MLSSDRSGLDDPFAASAAEFYFDWAHNLVAAARLARAEGHGRTVEQLLYFARILRHAALAELKREDPHAAA